MNENRIITRNGLAALLLLLAASAGAQTGGTTPPSTGYITAAPTLNDLRSFEYTGIGAPRATVQLRDGRWEGPARTSATYLRDMWLTGDLDADRDEEALAFLGYNAGGTGTLYYIAVVDRTRDGTLRNVATALVGDRVQFRDARIENGRIVLQLIQGGPRDPACCPGNLVTRTWTLRRGRLVESGRGVVTGRLTMDVLGSDEWRLTHWNLNEPVDATTAITLAHADGQLSGIGGCNPYSVGVRSGRLQAGDLKVESVTGGEATCSDALMRLENRFFQALQGANRYSFFAGQLALTYRVGTRDGTMLFTRAEAPAVP